MKRIRLFHKKWGTKYLIVDDSDYVSIKKYSWNLKKSNRMFYAVRYGTSVHRFILKAKRGQLIDHINANGLDNRRNNLRFATSSQNGMNARLSLGNSTGFKGVILDKKKKLYRAVLRLNRKAIHGGRFRDILKAAQKYNELAIEYFGKFARLNKFTNAQKKILKKGRIIPLRIYNTNTTGYRGVFYSSNHVKRRLRGAYGAMIRHNGKAIYLGHFKTAIKAARAYNAACVTYKKSKEFLNKIPA